jgi:hypothetical protein
LTTVAHDATLTGDGTSGTPLGSGGRYGNQQFCPLFCTN